MLGIYNFVGDCMLDVIYQTWGTVFHRDPNTEKRVENSAVIRTCNRVFLMKFEGLELADETLSRVFDILSQSKQKLSKE